MVCFNGTYIWFSEYSNIKVFAKYGIGTNDQTVEVINVNELINKIYEDMV